jgi:hypothetical protein
MTAAPGPEHRRLEALVGVWKTQGWTREESGSPPARIDATDSYEWLPGGFGLLHTVDARVGDESVEGAEIIGYDPDRGGYVTQYFGSDGPTAYEADLRDDAGTLVWTMRSADTRFTGVFSDGGGNITGHWEAQRPDGVWEPWMDITLTKQGAGAAS